MPARASSGEEALLPGLCLPAAWCGRPQWRILEFDCATSLNFLLSWHAWQRDRNRPRMLHYVAIGPVLDRAFTEPMATVARIDALVPLASRLVAQCWGLMPGVHRLAFDAGRVLLTLCIGPSDAMLREQRFEADSVLFDDLGAGHFPLADVHGVKALARCCRRGTRVVGAAATLGLEERLAQGGFSVRSHANSGASNAHTATAIDAVFDPRWQPRARTVVHLQMSTAPQDAVVIGAGLAGAAVAASLARRGHRVSVLDGANEPAAGASSLPAGLFAPHVSVDDNLLSRLTRAGIRQTIQFSQERLADGADWHMSGVLEVRPNAQNAIAGRCAPSRDWTGLATPHRLASAGLPASTTALWHRRAGWIKPAALVRALLADPLIEFRGGARVHHLAAVANGWRALGADGALLAEAPLVVIAAGHESAALAPLDLPLQPIGGQVSFGSQPVPAITSSQSGIALPPFPVNGHGSFLPGVPFAAGPVWITGATYRRDQREAETCAADHVENLDRLRQLLPRVAHRLAPTFERGELQCWAGVRCAAPDRLPVFGPINPERAPGLWIAGAMGSRGLTFAMICAELLAARLHGEPLALSPRLAKAIDSSRFAPKDRARPAALREELLARTVRQQG